MMGKLKGLVMVETPHVIMLYTYKIKGEFLCHKSFIFRPSGIEAGNNR